MTEKKKKLKRFLVEWRGSGYGDGTCHSVISGKNIRNALRRADIADVEKCLKYGINWYEEKK